MARHHILLIDDDLYLPRLIAFGLEQFGDRVQLHHALDGRRGLELAQDVSPHLILLDFGMPGLDGLETLRQLRAIPAIAHVPIIAVSGSLNTNGRCAEMIVGCDAYLPKPLDFQRLNTVIARFLNLAPDAAASRPV